ncbi:MAG: phosphate ABC transporter permease PstA [Deferrisomatales bacterium]|nr:phosphate ABC transporter permease PstA [Deferrisomatales bacterium]
MKRLWSALGRSYLVLCTLATVAVLLGFLGHIALQGWEVLGWEFLTAPPRRGMTEGGIFPAIAGTAMVSLLTVFFALPLGVGAAVYLNEYARDAATTRMIRLAIRNLSGVPSVVYGLFGVVLFVDLLGLGTSLLSAGLTLGLLTLPWIITASEEALRGVPQSYRDGALALGATRWQAVRTVVLPPALPGILTGAILGLSRAAGETAPILFTGVAFYLPFVPGSLSDQFMALPYHLYILSTQHHAIEKVRPLAYGTALVLVALVFTLNLGAFAVRSRMRRKLESAR